MAKAKAKVKSKAKKAPAKKVAKKKAAPKAAARKSVAVKSASPSVSAELAKLRAEVKGVAAMRKELTELQDRQAIRDTLALYTRSVDRLDWDLLQNRVYHPDGIADHGGVVGHIPDLVKWLDHRYHEMYITHQHIITNHMCEIDGNTAHCETYVMTAVLPKHAKEVMLGGARYIDRLEKRNGVWKILLRRIVADWRGRLESTQNGVPMSQGPTAPQGKWNRTDITYQRPLKLPAERAKEMKVIQKSAQNVIEKMPKAAE